MEKYILFKVAGEGFGISIGQVVEIITSLKANPVPEVPEYISGVFTLRGDVIPLVDLRKRFGMTPVPRKERVIIIRSGKEKIGLLVDEVTEIKGFSEKELASTPGLMKGLKTEYLKGIARDGNGMAIILNIDRILSSEERILLKSA